MVWSGAVWHGRHGMALLQKKGGTVLVYKWKPGSQHKVSAQTAGEVCKALEEKGELTAKNLLDVSRPSEAPLHNEFEWDNETAAELYRTAQAGSIIRHLVIAPEKAEPVRAFFTLNVKTAQYESLQTIITQKEKYDLLLNQAKSELFAFQRKYQTLAELQNVFEAINELN